MSDKCPARYESRQEALHLVIMLLALCAGPVLPGSARMNCFQLAVQEEVRGQDSWKAVLDGEAIDISKFE